MSSGSGGVSAVYEILYNPNYRPKRSPRAHIEKITVDGNPALVLMKESENEYYDVDEETNTIWQLLDGRRTIKDVYNDARQTEPTLTEKDVRDTVVSLAEEGILESTEPQVKRKRVELASAFQLDIHLLKDSSKSLAGFFRVTRSLIQREELPVAIAIGIVGIALFYGNFLRIFANPSVFEIAGSTVLGFFFYELIVMLPIYAVHELAHAAVCDYYGAQPHEIGTGLYYLAPYFYCDTSDSWRLSRRARIMISLAGPLSTITISSFLVVFSYITPPGYLQDVLKVAAFFGFYGSLINFSPVIETDGYYILADALNIPNLRDESFSYIKRLLSRAIRRPVKAVRMGARRVRIIAIYSVISVLWLAYFAYTTLWLMLIYSGSAYSAVLSLGGTVLRAHPFDLTAVGVDIATLSYFGLFLAGFVVLGAVSFMNVRMRGVRLETIHDKRVSVFLPLPSSLQRSRGSELAAMTKKAAAGYARSYSVTLEPPLCVAALKLGRVSQSIEDMRGEMRRIEQSFRAIHRDFVRRHLGSSGGLPSKKALADNILQLAREFSPSERRRTVSAARRFLRRQDERLGYLLQSAFGTVWTLELSPEDYARIKRTIFPTLIADDMGATDLPSDLEEFKKRFVLGSDAIAQLSSEIEEESKEVYGAPEVYQVTVFLEPVKSRLVFVGRTDKVAGSIIWLGGLYLYQAWISYVGELLEDSGLGLKSLRLSRTISLTRTQTAKLKDRELEILERDLGRFAKLAQGLEQGLLKIESTYQSALNFHETLDTLVSDEAFDVGLYRPSLRSNQGYLEGFGERVGRFRDEFKKVSKKLESEAATVREERSRRAADPALRRKTATWDILAALPLLGRRGASTPAFDSEVKFMFTAARLTYGAAMASDAIL